MLVYNLIDGIVHVLVYNLIDGIVQTVLVYNYNRLCFSFVFETR